MAFYRILTWKGIPAQIKVRGEEGARPLSVPLSERWMQEIDRVAMADGLSGTDTYLAEWQWSDEEHWPGTAEQVAEALVAELEATWVKGRRPSRSK